MILLLADSLSGERLSSHLSHFSHVLASDMLTRLQLPSHFEHLLGIGAVLLGLCAIIACVLAGARFNSKHIY